MGPLIKALFAVSLTVLFIQGAHTEAISGSEADKTEESSTALSTQVIEDGLEKNTTPEAAAAPSELQTIDDTTNDIISELDQRIAKATEYVQAVNNWIGWAYSVSTVKKAVRRSLRMGRHDISQARYQVRNVLCDRYEQFKAITETTAPADAELAKAVKTLEPTASPQLDAVFTGMKDHRKRILRREKSRDPTTLPEWKEYFVKMSQESMESYNKEMKAIEESARVSLNTLYNALATWQDANVDLKDAQEKPQNIEGKLALIRAAMDLGKKLGCPSSNQPTMGRRRGNA